jgi:hypothetical protein
VGFFLFFMAWQPLPAYSAQAGATVICQDSNGNQQTYGIGWNNENDYFLDKGNIPQHFCEGGFAGEFTIFVSVVSVDGSELDPALLYHPGYVPNTEPEPVPSVGPSPEATQEPEVIEPSPEPSVEPTLEPEVIQPSPEVVEPSPEPAPEPSQEPVPVPAVEPTPEPTPTLISPIRPVEPITPEISPSPTPEPVEPSTSLTEPEIEQTPIENLLMLPQLALEQVAKLVDNLRSIGSDMSPEVREQSQQVIVASVIVTQVALAGRKF